MDDCPKYEFMDDTLIDDEFRCSICNEPFEKPTCTPCDHTFCRSCIEEWLKKSNDTNSVCPVCRHPLSIDDDLKPASRIISNRIDRYLVKCSACQQDKIPRGEFADHVSKMCGKTNVSCSACDILCPWIGPRNQLSNHLATCPYQKIRPALKSLLAKNILLENILINQQEQITTIREKCQAQEDQINQLSKMIQSPTGQNNVSIKRSITFEDVAQKCDKLNSYDAIPSNYAGFRWINAAFMPRQHGIRSYPNTGFATAFRGEQKCVAFNFGCQAISFRSLCYPFCILSFTATCAFQNEVTLTVTGRRTTNTIHSTTFILHCQELKMFTLNWNNIDELEFLPSGGKQLSTSTDTDRHVIITCLNFG